MSAVAVTDHGNMFGAIDFYKKAKEAGIKPILGIEAYVAGTKGRDGPHREGGQPPHPPGQERGGLREPPLPALHRPTSTASTTTRASTSSCSRSTAKGLFGLTACLGGEVTSGLLPRRHGPRPRARRSSTRTSSSPGHFFLEIQSNGHARAGEGQRRTSSSSPATSTSRSSPPPTPTTSSARTPRAHELLMCIASGKTLADSKRMRHAPTSSTSPAPRRCWPTSRTCPRRSHNTHAHRRAVHARAQARQADAARPSRCPTATPPDSYMAELATHGPRASASRSCTTRSTASLPRAPRHWSSASSARWASPATSSSSRTSSTGRRSTASRWARAAARAPARIVAYALRITDLDPIPYNLLFERFLNPERVSMPDFDVDFCQDRRDEVIDYVPGKYGEDNVGQIITFGSLKAKSVLRDVCRVFGPALRRGRPHRQAGPRGPRTSP